MTAIDKLKQIQGILGVEQDGSFGPKSRQALDQLIAAASRSPVPTPVVTPSASQPVFGTLVGDSTWPWIKAHIDGQDIVIKDAVCTAFGGKADNMDSGETASGVSTKDNPSFIGCALPMRRDGSSALRGSPIPKIPWKSTVLFTDPKTGTSVSTKLIDEGPAKWTKHGGDLTEAAAKLFDPHANANNFTKTLDIRIIGGAQYVLS